MKRVMIASTLAAFLFLTGIVILRAETREWHGWHGPRWQRFGPAAYMAHELNLSPDQKTQIRALWQAERPTLAANLHDLLSENRQMDAISTGEHPDSGEAQAAADREAKTIAALLMEKEHLQSEIYTKVLNSGQRAKADELHKRWNSRLDRLANHLETQPAEK